MKINPAEWSWVRGLRVRDGTALRLIVLAIVQSTGTGVFLTSAPFFLTKVVGIPPEQLGLGFTIAGLCGLLACVPIGMIGDRFSPSRVLAIVYALLGVFFTLYCFVNSLLAFVLVAAAIAVFESSCGPLLIAMVYEHYRTGEEAVPVRAQMRSAANVGFPVGAAVAGIAIAVGGRPAFVVVIVSTAVVNLMCAVLVAGIHRGLHRARVPRGVAAVTPAALTDLRFVSVALVNGLIQMNEVILTLGVPLWIVNFTTAPPSFNAIVLIANSVLVVALQVRVSRTVTTVSAATRALRRAGALVGLSCLIYAASQNLPSWGVLLILLSGVTVQTVGEIYQASAVFTIAFELTVPARQAEYQGVIALGAAFRQFVGPVIVSSLVIGLGRPGWVLLGLLFTGLGILAVPLVRALEQYRLLPAKKMPA